MGLYVNPSNESFAKATKNEIFVDKSMLLSELNKRIGTENCFLAVSRPRRFGKTMAESMMAAYYSKGCDSAELFKGLKIAGDPSFSNHLNKYNVLYLDINRFWSDYGNDALVRLKGNVIEDFKKEFHDADYSKCTTISDCIVETYRTYSVPFVIILDEYDVIFRTPECSPLIDKYLSVLNALFKSADVLPSIALAYITGILPVIREKAQSKLNNFREITFLKPGRFASFTGFTTDEVRNLCGKYDMDFDECRRWYDGYSFKGVEIYSPRSVVSAMEFQEYDDYWVATSQYEAILDYIRLDLDGLKEDVERMISGDSVEVDVLTFTNTISNFRFKDDVLTYLCHLGYLAYDYQTKTCRIPNYEIKGEWVRALRGDERYSSVIKLVNASKEVLKAAWNMDRAHLAEALEKAHEHLASNLSYNNEQSLQSAIRLAFFYADDFYTIAMEYPAGKGYADIVFIPYKPNIPAMLVELKVKGTANTALDQIRKKRYFAGLEKFEGNTLLIGVSYDRKTKKHECVIDKA